VKARGERRICLRRRKARREVVLDGDLTKSFVLDIPRAVQERVLRYAGVSRATNVEHTSDVVVCMVCLQP
jgi:hypothetical protein